MAGSRPGGSKTKAYIYVDSVGTVERGKLENCGKMEQRLFSNQTFQMFDLSQEKRNPTLSPVITIGAYKISFKDKGAA